MAYKRHKPVSEKKMLKEKYLHHHTICATLRRIYLKIENEDVKYELRVAMSMAKSMHNKLKEYKEKEDSLTTE